MRLVENPKTWISATTVWALAWAVLVPDLPSSVGEGAGYATLAQAILWRLPLLVVAVVGLVAAVRTRVTPPLRLSPAFAFILVAVPCALFLLIYRPDWFEAWVTPVGLLVGAALTVVTVRRARSSSAWTLGSGEAH